MILFFQPLSIPDITSADSVHSLAMACIWIHLSKKVFISINLNDTMFKKKIIHTMLRHQKFQEGGKITFSLTRCFSGNSKLSCDVNPFTPMSDQDRISPYSINTILSR